ncbi:MAG: MBL fold metallo-hydrolase [Candidatus Hodarchaeota archaeon]
MTEKNIQFDPINDLTALSLNDVEFAFINFGWAGILLKAKQKTVAFDLCKQNLKQNVAKINILDIQFNSHIHGDHFDIKGTTQLFQQTGAKIVVESTIFEELKGKIPNEALFSANPDKPINIDEFTINSIEGSHLCPICLFQVEWNNFSVFHGGDSDYVPLENYQTDLAFIPTGSPSPTCSPEKGLKMVLDVKPKVVVPMHGTKAQMKKFETLIARELPKTKVIIPEKNQLIKAEI